MFIELPSAPTIHAETDESYETFNVTIFPPQEGALCVTQYNVTVTDNIGNTYTGNVNVSNYKENITMDIQDIIGNTSFEICKRRYKFQVTASNGKESSPLTSPIIDFSSEYHVVCTNCNKVSLQHGWTLRGL